MMEQTVWQAASSAHPPPCSPWLITCPAKFLSLESATVCEQYVISCRRLQPQKVMAGDILGPWTSVTMLAGSQHQQQNRQTNTRHLHKTVLPPQHLPSAWGSTQNKHWSQSPMEAKSEEMMLPPPPHTDTLGSRGICNIQICGVGVVKSWEGSIITPALQMNMFFLTASVKS